MVTADQIVCHLIGDYVLQSHWMATNKTKDIRVAALHAATYSLPFLFLGPSLFGWFVLVMTHAFIDRFRIARMVVWVKNFQGCGNPPWAECRATGFSPDTPAWLAVWLLIIVDNILHLCVNAFCFRYL